MHILREDLLGAAQEQTCLPSASGVQDFYPQLPKDLTLPSATENGRNEAETPAPQQRRNPHLPLARGSPAWTPNVSHKIMHALWMTIFYCEAAGAWCAHMNVKNKRVEYDAGQRIFIVALKAAWSTLNDGIESAGQSPSPNTR
jgi:hypothetical protein